MNNYEDILIPLVQPEKLWYPQLCRNEFEKKGVETMEGAQKRSFWKRCNRGFLVSMILLAAVLVYVLIGQIRLLSVRAELRDITDRFNALWNEATLLSDEEAAALKGSADQQAAEQRRIKSELQKEFLPEASYLDAAVNTLYAGILEEYDGTQRTTGRSAILESRVETCNIQEDTALMTVRYDYTVDGQFVDYRYSEDLMEVRKAPETMYVSLQFKKVEGTWKVFRVVNLYSLVNVEMGEKA